MSDYIRMREVFIGGHLICLTDEYYRILQSQMFLEIWRTTKHIDAISLNPIKSGARTYFFHHILEKQAYERYALCKWNIALLDYETHNTYETNPLKVPQLMAQKQLLLDLLNDPDYAYDNDHIWNTKTTTADYTHAFMGREIKEGDPL